MNVYDLLRFGRVVAGFLRIGGRWWPAAVVGLMVTCGYFLAGLAR